MYLLLVCCIQAMLLNTSIQLHMGTVWTLFYPLCYLLPFSEMKRCHVSHTVPSHDSSHRAQETAQSSVGCLQQTLPSGEALGKQREAGVQLPAPNPHGENSAFPAKGTSWHALPSQGSAWPFADSIIFLRSLRVWHLCSRPFFPKQY